jgi:hypothetical protein
MKKTMSYHDWMMNGMPRDVYDPEAAEAEARRRVRNLSTELTAATVSNRSDCGSRCNCKRPNDAEGDPAPPAHLQFLALVASHGTRNPIVHEARRQLMLAAMTPEQRRRRAEQLRVKVHGSAEAAVKARQRSRMTPAELREALMAQVHGSVEAARAVQDARRSRAGWANW